MSSLSFSLTSFYLSSSLGMIPAMLASFESSSFLTQRFKTFLSFCLEHSPLRYPHGCPSYLWFKSQSERYLLKEAFFIQNGLHPFSCMLIFLSFTKHLLVPEITFYIYLCAYCQASLIIMYILGLKDSVYHSSPSAQTLYIVREGLLQILESSHYFLLTLNHQANIFSRKIHHGDLGSIECFISCVI